MTDPDAHGWRPIETAPKDGKHIRVLYDDASWEDGVCWLPDRQCMLGSRAGECGPGWAASAIGYLPVGDDPHITHWQPLPPPPVTNDKHGG